MTKTENYNLNQWESSDRVLMEDFNEDNAKIEAALTSMSGERVSTGSYTGNGATKRIITLPFTPKFVMVMGHINADPGITIATASNETYFTASSIVVNSTDSVRVVENGFQVARNFAAWHNTSGKTVTYIAVQ